MMIVAMTAATTDHGRINQADDSWHTHIHFSQCDMFGYRWVSHAIKFTLILCVSFIHSFSFSVYVWLIFYLLWFSYSFIRMRDSIFLHLLRLLPHTHTRSQADQPNKQTKTHMLMQRLRTQTHLDFSFDNVFALNLLIFMLSHTVQFRMTYTRIRHTD